MALVKFRKHLAGPLVALALVTGGVTAGSVATAPPAAAASYGPVVNVKMGPFTYKWQCVSTRYLYAVQNHVVAPCYESYGKWYFHVNRFYFTT